MSMFQTPMEIGQSVALTKLYPDEMGFIPDGRGNKVCHVRGQLVHVADLDRPASNRFKRECLTWRLAIASRIMNSSVKDVSVQPVNPSTVHELRSRFPGAFTEFESRYGSDQLPDRSASSMPNYVRSELVGDYNGPDTYDAYLDFVRNLREVAPMGKEDRRRDLQRQLAELDGPDASGEPEEDSPFAPPTSGTPLIGWGAIPVNARRTLISHGIQTVQEFAAANDSLIETLGAGNWNKWRTKAIEESGPDSE